MTRCFLALLSLVAVFGTPAKATVIAFPDESRQLELDLSGLELAKDKRRPDGRSRELLYRSEDLRFNLLVELKPAMTGMDATDYRDRRREQVETNSTVVAEGAKSSETGHVAHLEYVLEGAYSGAPFSQRHFHSFLRSGSWRVEVHVVIREFRESDRQWLDAVRTSMAVIVRNGPAQGD